MKKVIMYTSGTLFQRRQTGGIKRFIELTKFFAHEYPLTILCSQDDESNIKQLAINNFVKIKGANQNLKWIPPEAALLFANKNVIRQFRKTNYDCLVVFDVPTAIGIVLFGLKKIVLLIRKDMIGCELANNPNCWYKISFKLMCQWVCELICLLKVKRIICQCAYDKNTLMRRHPIFASVIQKKTDILINNVNPTWAINGFSRGIKSHIKIPTKFSRFKICYIGGFDRFIKGYDIILEVAHELVRERNDLEFILVGGGKKLNEYKQKYSSNDILFTGHLDNPIAILKSSNLLVVPSRIDSCPNTVLEALNNEIPVIGSKVGGIPEILVYEDSLFDLNKKSLKDRILKLIDDKYALYTLRKHQFERKEMLTFDWAQKMAELILK